MIVAVDFDGTLTESSGPLLPPYPPTPPLRTDVVEDLKALKEQGHVLVLWTSRSGDGLKEAVDLCRSAGLEFDHVNESPAGGWPKIKADIYLDDRAVGTVDELLEAIP